MGFKAARAEAVGPPHVAGTGGGLARALGSEPLGRRLATGGLAGDLFGAGL